MTPSHWFPELDTAAALAVDAACADDGFEELKQIKRREEFKQKSLAKLRGIRGR